MFRYLPSAFLLFTLSACGQPVDAVGELSDVRDQRHAGGKADGLNKTESCTITMCLTGAMDHRTPSNEGFRALCDDSRLNGIEFDCHGDRCNSTFDSFLQFPLLTVYPALIEALDRNFDGTIDEADPVCEINLIGFSWGGVNALSVAGHLHRDSRVPESHRRVTRAVLLDAFQPLSAERMTVPDNVDSLLSMRHSVAPNNDCSRFAPLGPYKGLAPICSAEQNCQDYDYSLGEDTLFPAAWGGQFWGDEVGHCMVPSVAHEQVIDFIQGRPLSGTVPPAAD